MRNKRGWGPVKESKKVEVVFCEKKTLVFVLPFGEKKPRKMMAEKIVERDGLLHAAFGSLDEGGGGDKKYYLCAEVQPSEPRPVLKDKDAVSDSNPSLLNTDSAYCAEIADQIVQGGLVI